MKTKFFKTLFVLLISIPFGEGWGGVLSAQNGVTVSGLAMNAGTVTFNVNWDRDAMPVTVWSDTVWVFVDYNKAGVMTRLPLSAGATLTGTSAPGFSWVEYAANNNQGVWVVGNARTDGSFSATVQLLTATADIAGACVYASNYSPVGEYTATDKITFTGTPPYDIVFSGSGGNLSINDSDYTIPLGVTIASFSDKTGVSGILMCTPPAIYTLSGSDVCLNSTVSLTLSGSQSGWQYQLYKGSTAIGGIVNGTGSALTFSEAATTAGIFDYTVQRMSPANMQCEMLVSNMRSITVTANPVISAHPAAVSVCPGSTVTLSVTASPVTAYRWRKNGSATSEGSNYTSTAYTTVALIAGTTYSVVVANSSCSVTSNNAVVTMKTSGCGIDQPQGSCTYTVPAVISTFAAFPSNYSASTYVSLTDERDSKNYPVVKIGSRWIMARNLNYQGTNSANTLTWQTNAAQPSTGTGSNTALIGHFWCPGAHGSATSTRTSCEVWGALYSWETAMMVDGKWSDDNRNSTAWSNPVVSANTVSGNTNNGGKGANNHGICPPNWHVPTDGEWGDVLNAMETDSKNHNASTGWLGTNAGTRGKSKCGGTATDANAYWSSGAGTDDYGFRVLPTDDRNYDGSAFAGPRGSYAQFWSSSAYDGSTAWRRDFSYSEARVVRDATNRSYGYVVRCIRD